MALLLSALLISWFRLAESGRLGCTALAIDGAASTTGGAFAVENTDCNNCDFRLNFVPPAEHPKGAKRAVYLNPVAYPRFVGYGKGTIYHPLPGQALTEPVAYIPQVERTFGFYESIAPLMNDQGLAIAESSCGAMLQNKPPGSKEARRAPTGILDAMSIMQLALERCATARCAVDTVGALAEEYGYLPFGGEPTEGEVGGRPTWADSGEAYTIADASGEAWVLSMVGGVEGVLRSVWAAQRVPKGHIAVVANELIMGELPAEPNDDFRFPHRIREAAIAAGLWDGRGAFDFAKVFAPDPTLYTTKGNPPTPLYTSLRRWRLLDLAAPSLKLKLEMDHRVYPFSVKVERPITHRDVMAMMKDHYNGTEFDLSQGVLAGPYRTPFRVEGGPVRLGDVPRGISIYRTLYGTISQTGPNGSVSWYAADTPATSVYIPLDKGSGDAVASVYSSGHNRKFDRSSAWWAFGFVNNWMQLNYHGMSTEDVLPRAEAWQDRIDRELAQARSSGTTAHWQVRMQEDLAADWWRLADFLVMKWNDMSRTSENATAISLGYPEWWARMVGFNEDIHPLWVTPAAQSPSCASDTLPVRSAPCPDVMAPTVTLPHAWDHKAQTWIEWGFGGFSAAAATSEAKVAPQWAGLAFGGTLLFAAGTTAGYLAGRSRRLATWQDGRVLPLLS